MIEDKQIITIPQARKMLEMSKADFVDLLNDDSTNRLITSYEDQVREHIKRYGYKGSKNIEYFTISMLDNNDLYIDGIDWKNFCKNKLYTCIDKLEINAIEFLNNENQTLKRELAERQKENLELKEKLTAYENEEQPKGRTDKATLVRTQRDFEAWKSALPAMLKVYRQCVLDGEKERTEESIRKMFEKSGYGINPSMLKAFKKAMDPAYVKTTPGASKSNP